MIMLSKIYFYRIRMKYLFDYKVPYQVTATKYPIKKKEKKKSTIAGILKNNNITCVQIHYLYSSNNIFGVRNLLLRLS